MDRTMNNKYLNLEQARKDGQLDRFAKLHSVRVDRDRFERLLNAMSLGVLEKAQRKRGKRSADFDKNRGET